MAFLTNRGPVGAADCGLVARGIKIPFYVAMISSSASEQDTGHKLPRRLLRLQVFLRVCVELLTEYWEKFYRFVATRS